MCTLHDASKHGLHTHVTGMQCSAVMVPPEIMCVKSEVTVQQYLQHKASGPDNIGPLVLKELYDIMLEKSFNASLKNHVVP